MVDEAVRENSPYGLTDAEVQEKMAAGLVNTPEKSGTLTEKEIVRNNVFTYFNGIFVILAVLLIIAGKFTDLGFMFVVICNTLIGIVQQIQSKRAVDRLSILSSRKITVIRDGKRSEIPSESLVEGDVCEIQAGMQIPADGTVVSGKVKVNESLLSGEEDDIAKDTGELLHSGSVCTSGSCMAKLTAVGKDSYAAKLSKEATTDVRIAKSDMMKSLDRLILIVGIVLIPMGILLFVNEFWIIKDPFAESVQSTVAALIGMIPEGLYLLTSVALAASVLRLSKNRVLVRDLNCVETLARIDVLCVDKTGTITEPGMTVDRLVVLHPTLKEAEIRTMLSAYANTFEKENETGKAMSTYFSENPGWKVRSIVPFSSSLKYSAVSFEGHGTIVTGAPQFVLHNRVSQIEGDMRPYTEKGQRVLVAVRYHKELDGKELDPASCEIVGLIVLSNNVRKNAKETFEYFNNQGVTVKVISGDDPETVSRIARQVEIPNSEKYIDCTTLKTDESIAKAIERYTVFGRTTPDQKKKMVLALQKNKHHVAMTGDGVNDVLALKEADCGIAMASGSEAASQIAQLVLLDSEFSAVPGIVAEGRRVINNIERSAMLFLSKNLFSFGLSLLCILAGLSYPFKPLQLSFISAMMIGIPGFFLAMQPNDGLISGRFLANVIYQAFPGGLCDLTLIGGLVVYSTVFGFSETVSNTMAVCIALLVGIMILYQACKPIKLFHILVLGGISVVTITGILVFHEILSIHRLGLQPTLIFVLFILLAYPVMKAYKWILDMANGGYHKVIDFFSGIHAHFEERKVEHRRRKAEKETHETH